MGSSYFVYLALILNASSAFSQVVGTSQDVAVSEITVSSVQTISSTFANPVSSTVVLTSTIQATTVAPTLVSSSATATPTLVTSEPPVPTPAPAFRIHPNGNAAKCLDVRGAILANGTPVQIFDCNGSLAQNWNIGPGRTKVVLSGTGFCLDAGSTPANGVGMKIWQCFDNLPAQDWFYTADQRIALTNQGQCLDLTNGNLANSNQVQTWQCTDLDVNQVWTISN